MGLDNARVACGAGRLLLVVLGLLISIPIMVWGSRLILAGGSYPMTIHRRRRSRLTAAKMIRTNPWLQPHPGSRMGQWVVDAVVIVGVLSVGWLRIAVRSRQASCFRITPRRRHHPARPIRDTSSAPGQSGAAEQRAGSRNQAKALDLRQDRVPASGQSDGWTGQAETSGGVMKEVGSFSCWRRCRAWRPPGARRRYRPGGIAAVVHPGTHGAAGDAGIAGAHRLPSMRVAPEMNKMAAGEQCGTRRRHRRLDSSSAAS